MQQITRKLPNGKLVRISVDGKDVISTIQITGDFFCHPEEAVEEMEKLLLGLSVPISIDEAKQTLDDYVQKNNVVLVGITTEAITSMINEAFQQ